MKPEQQVQAVFKLLKAHLKAKKLAYREIAERLKMSESNLKRIFSSQTCGLEQLTRICEASEISFFELVRAASKDEVATFTLPPETEEYFLKNFDQFIFYRNLAGSRDPNVYLGQSKLPKSVVESYLASFENFKLVRRTRTGFQIPHSGYLDLSATPRLAKKLTEKWVPWFIDRTMKNTEQSDEYALRLGSTGLTRAHRDQLITEVEQLLLRYRQTGLADQQIGSREFVPVGICIAVGPHRVGFFENGHDEKLPFKQNLFGGASQDPTPLQMKERT